MSRPNVHPGAERVVVGLSGGVDSAVAAALLLAEGYDVHGLAIETWRHEVGASGAASSELPGNPSGAAEVAGALGIPLLHRDLRDTFYSKVVTPFLDEYARGRTPNPCVTCNPTLKAAALIEEADRLGARWIATGHYARVIRTGDGLSRLLTAKARDKDQSYALYRLDQSQLSRLRLPLGDLESKALVRQIARDRGLPSADAADSQDLCFAAGTTYQELVAKQRPDAVRPGPIYDQLGNHIGDHKGLPFYTIGQRSGLGIAAPQRLYVLRLDHEANALIVGPRSGLARKDCRIGAVTFTTGRAPAAAFEALARIRYRAPATPVSVELADDDTAGITFHTPQIGVAPGQSLVLYSGEETLGGGVIT